MRAKNKESEAVHEGAVGSSLEGDLVKVPFIQCGTWAESSSVSCPCLDTNTGSEYCCPHYIGEEMEAGRRKMPHLSTGKPILFPIY